jgi:trehalose 6-phosphate synthase/phosphatase
VNRIFAEKMKSYIKNDDKIWIHDYHLLLLPQMIREDFPDVNIGFFLHIPFPSFELFRMLPWRKEILEGMLGADLI